MPEEHNVWESFQTEDVALFGGNYARVRFLASLFRKGERVLDIGVGNGGFEEAAIAGGVDVYSLDPGEKSVAGLRSRLGLGEKAVVGRSEAIPFGDAYFDAVVMSEVLEHLSDAELAGTLREVGRVLRPGGTFAGTVPNEEALSEQLTICPRCGEKFHRWGHKRSFSAGTLSALLRGSFGAVSAERRLFIPWTTLNWKGRAAAAVRVMLAKAGSFGSRDVSLFFLCRR